MTIDLALLKNLPVNLTRLGRDHAFFSVSYSAKVSACANRSCFESAAMTDPQSSEASHNSTPPFKFRQTKSCEVRSRLAELSVE